MSLGASYRSTSQYEVVVLPDFFVDIIIDAGELEEFVRKVREVHGRGGGNILVKSKIQRGGNAANTAAALAALGVRSVLISKVDPIGARLIKALMPDVELVLNEMGETPITAALEFRRDGYRSNVMLSFSGSVRYFSVEDIPEGGVERIRRANVVAIMNLAQNWRGNDLVRGVYKLVEGRRPIYVDPSDVSNALDRLGEFVELMRGGIISMLAVNENEITVIARALGHEPRDVFDAATVVYEEARLQSLDVHTERFAFSLPSNVVVPSFEIEPVISTGAGDAWNGGNILGYLMGLNAEERLKLANAVAGFYITKGRHGGLDEVLEFMRKTPQRTLSARPG